MITGVVGAIIWTDDLDRLLDFYENILGLNRHSRHGDFVSFRWGKFRLGIGVHKLIEGSSKDSYRIMINFGTKDILPLVQQLKDKGVKFLREPDQEHWGGIVATLEDPDGNVIQLLQQPKGREHMG